MATLDNINIFANGGPAENTIEDDYQKLVAVINGPGVMGTPPTFEEFVAMRQKIQAADVARETMLSQLGEGNVKQAYEEGFTQLPLAEQMAAYVFPPTGVPIEAYETGYFTDKAGFEMKNLPEFALDVLNPFKNIAQKLPFKAEDPVSAVLAPLSALGMAGGIGELANIPKAAILMGRRLGALPEPIKLGLSITNSPRRDITGTLGGEMNAPIIQAANTTGGGGGGIGGLTIPNQEPTRDLAGYKSNTLEEAKSVSAEMSPKALLQYIKSNKRTNPSSNKTGTALKQTEINEIDFETFEAQYPNKDYTNEDILKYIDDNRVQLYRVSRREDNPTYKDTKGEDIELYLDEPMTSEIRAEQISELTGDFGSFFREQKEFITSNFPDGINAQNFKDFAQRQDKLNETASFNRGASYLVDEFLVNNDFKINPFAALGKPQYDVYTPAGTLVTERSTIPDDAADFADLLDAGFTFKPKILTEDLGDEFFESAADSVIKQEYDLGDGVEAYRYVSDNNQFDVTGNASSGFNVRVNGGIDDDNFGRYLSFDEARLQIGQYEGTNVTKFDDPSSEDYLIDLVPDDVISGNATIPTKYEGYDGYKLPMGGAVDYEEHTLHLANPKTPTRYTGNDGTKHFGGGDELLHYRTTIRTDENGKKVLFVEEIQSDLHSTARSNKTDATYELSEKVIDQTRNKVNSIEPSRFVQLSGRMVIKFDKDMPQFNNISPSKNPNYLNPRQIKNTGDVIREKNGLKLDGVGPQEVIARFLVDEYGKEKILALVDAIEPISSSGNLPDFPYKKDWVDAAVKDAIKLGAELGVDRVSFTNAITQIQRNNKNLNYVQDTIITRTPTRQEILASPYFARVFAQDKKMYYDDYLNSEYGFPINTHNTNLPIPTMDEYYSRPSMGGESATNLDTVKEITYKQIARVEGVGQYRYGVVDVGYRLEGDEILNPQRIQMEGDDYVEQRMNKRMLQSDEELLAEIPEKYKEQVMKDLASGKQEITLNIDDIDGSGKKFLEIYKNEIPRGINKVLKDLKVKDAKPDISNILYGNGERRREELFETYKSDELQDLIKYLKESGDSDTATLLGDNYDLYLHPSIGIDLTDEMKKKIITEGFASMYMGGKVSKSNSMDRPIVGNRREM